MATRRCGPERHRTHTQAAQQKQAEDAAAAAANQPFDHFMGNDTGAFAYGDHDQDDKEADDTYAKIEDTMDERRKVSFYVGGDGLGDDVAHVPPSKLQ